MDGTTAGVVAFCCLFTAAAGGALLHARIPAAVLAGPVGATLRRSTWIVAVMASIMLATLTVYLKSTFDAADRDVRTLAFEIIELDHAMRRLGPQADPARAVLFRYTARTMKDIWPETPQALLPADTHADQLFAELDNGIARLSSDDPAARERIDAVRAELRDVSHARWEVELRDGRWISPLTEALLLLWLTLTFGGLGLSTERSPVALAVLGTCAAALASAVFLAVEYSDPYQGTIVVSSEPLRDALFLLSD